jgi:hypothetical protein
MTPCAVVICKEWKLSTVLHLFVVTTCKWSINPVPNPKPRRQSLLHMTTGVRLLQADDTTISNNKTEAVAVDENS